MPKAAGTDPAQVSGWNDVLALGQPHAQLTQRLWRELEWAVSEVLVHGYSR